MPDGVAYEGFSDNVRAMIAEVIEPAYEQLVVRPRDALEKITGLTIVHLVWQEILDQMDLARDYDNIGSVLNIVTPGREEIMERHLRLIYAKLKAGNYLMRVRDYRRGLARMVREAKAGPDAHAGRSPKAMPDSPPSDGPAGEPKPPKKPA